MLSRWYPCVVALLLASSVATSVRADEGSGADRLVPAVRAYLAAEEDEERSRLLDELEAATADSPLDLLAAFRALPPRPPAKPGRRLESFAIEGTDLEVQALVVIPAGYDPSREWPLWIGMHGTGGSGPSVASILAPYAMKKGFLLVCPSEHESRHGQGWGYTAQERSLVLSALGHMKRHYQVDPDRVYLNGWSRGGHASFDVPMHNPALFAGANPIIGAPRAQFFGLLRNLTSLRTRVLNGRKDQDLLVQSVRHGTDLLRKTLKADVDYTEDPDRGHEFLLDLLPAAVDDLLEARRDLTPQKLLVASRGDPTVEGVWLRIDRLKKKAYREGAPLKMRRLRGKNEAERLKEFQKAVFHATAWVEARTNGNHIILKSHEVAAVTLLLPEELIDFDRGLRVTHQGKTLFRGQPERDVRTLAGGIARRRDRKRGYWFELSLDLPR